MTEILRLGFAGLGAAATQVVPEIAHLPYIRLTAAADLRPAARDRFAQEFEAEAFESVEEMCQSPNVDAIYVATPHELHAEHAIVALQNRKHVIVEKPMALSLEDAEWMNRTADECGVKLMCGHTKSFDPPIRKMREVIRSGELGRICMVHTWNYNNFMVRPYPDHELAMSRGVVLNQGPHQVDIVRLLGGGLVRSVRATAYRIDASRPGEGAYAAYLEFEDGTPATVVYSGYGFFNASELHSWIGEGGQPVDPKTNVRSRRQYNAMKDLPDKNQVIEDLKDRTRYGGGRAASDWASRADHRSELRPPESVQRNAGADSWGGGGAPGRPRAPRHQKYFGPLVVSCERGEMRQSEDGVLIYGDEEVREVPCDDVMFGRQAEVTELYEGVVHGKPMFHDGRWGMATLEVCLAILQSAEERREILLSHQVPALD